MRGSHVLTIFPVALGKNPVGPKLRQGDNRTPEGNYVIDGRSWPNRFHRALHLSYPNRDDLLQAEWNGWDPGGNICIHGLPEGFEDLDPREFEQDWTNGCVAVSDHAIDQIWDTVEDFTPVLILA
jgi:murein L,D-transpeptidase YafK